MQCLQRSVPTRACTRTSRVAAFRPCQTVRRVAPKPFIPVMPTQLPNGRSPVACQGLFGLGFGEIAVVVGIAALVFGPSKLPELGKGLGQTVKSFQTAAKEFETELKQGMKEDEKPADGAAAEKKPESK
mmetsp:Transcript_27645/g.70424  ORF Transcript_27645/g.70424 Transcript_27645/m.70424 type:complete len:129 (-) Transcript_27645:434-820(-)